ncbi:hypothetical protein CDD80_4575 [Ophiocordyceps camponoti-rufipedis]|uniref:Uncharacterized protein n=1 Tax=Ophiocordyceps camponoti-rufipedis TaxID=2004952 RepID=A0A2C5YS64_9HYPO|nr:hypothetical protein CDD80_4575 [Ophiocordyceps camponoti-rufipedis]
MTLTRWRRDNDRTICHPTSVVASAKDGLAKEGDEARVSRRIPEYRSSSLSRLAMSSDPTAMPAPVEPGPTSALAYLRERHFLLLELKLLAGAVGIIYVGAHAALRRPPSASPVKRGRKDGKKAAAEDDDAPLSQGLELSDAITFPLTAAAMLIGLYYLIQWLQDPALLNKMLRTYLAAMSLASLTTLFAHSLDLASSFVFPRWWRGRDGALRRVEQKARVVLVCDDVGNAVVDNGSAKAVVAADSDAVAPRQGPLPGFLGLLTGSARARRLAWSVRSVLNRSWVARVFVRGVGDAEMSIGSVYAMSLLLSTMTAVVYFCTTSPLLSNLLGYSLCYGSFLIISPTDLLTGSLVLVGLFLYDIIMVFYTPYMLTVATQLDVPIKLTFQTAARKTMLGLGDIVLPGMVIGWALRLDLYMHYLGKIKYEPTELKVVQHDAASGEIVTRTETKHKEVKARYANVKGRWGDAFWTRGLFSARQAPAELAAASFRKTYFYASVAGYTLGLVVTVAMLLFFQKGQPALLYLVPGVLGALIATAWARGEMSDVWKYSEDGSLDKADVVVDLDAEGRVVKTLGKAEDGVLDTTGSKDKSKDGDKKDTNKDGGSEGNKGRQVALLSLEAASDDDLDGEEDS